jgi:hypothetical protein
VPAKAPNAAVGKLFVNWLLSEAGQTALQDSRARPVAARRQAAQLVPPNSALKITLSSARCLTPDYQQSMLKEFRPSSMSSRHVQQRCSGCDAHAGGGSARFGALVALSPTARSISSTC